VSYYQVLLFCHLVAAMSWAGGDLMLQMFYLRARATGPDAVVQFAKNAEWVGLRLLNPAALLVVIFGVLLVIEVDGYEFSQFWISAGLAMFLASAITGAAFLGPETGRIGTLAEGLGADEPEVQSRVARVLWISRIELCLLILIVLDMVVKPGL
jgi:uncharacterized membrane protein